MKCCNLYVYLCVYMYVFFCVFSVYECVFVCVCLCALSILDQLYKFTFFGRIFQERGDLFLGNFLILPLKMFQITSNKKLCINIHTQLPLLSQRSAWLLIKSQSFAHPKPVSITTIFLVLMSLRLDIYRLSKSQWISILTSIKFLSLNESCSGHL